MYFSTNDTDVFKILSIKTTLDLNYDLNFHYVSYDLFIVPEAVKGASHGRVLGV